MLYSQEIERDARFKLALRIGIPILVLVSVIIFVIFKDGRFNLFNLSLLLLTIFASIYFIFFMIYEGLSQKITDPVSKAFNRETILKYLQKDISVKEPYSVILISIDNLTDINERYGIEKGDKVLEKFAEIIDDYFKKRYGKVPIGHYKGGEFLIGVQNSQESIKSFLDEFIKRYDRTKIDDIDIKIFATLTDKNYSKDIKKIVEYLYQLYTDYQYIPKSKRVLIAQKKNIEANKFEKFIIDTVENKSLSIRFQPSFNLKTLRFDLIEIIVKLIDKDGSIIHPSQFIPVINRLGFEKRFDQILIEKVLKTIEEDKLPKNIYYSFNLSPFSIRDKKFTEDIKNIFNKFEVPKNSIVLELFENRLYKDIDYYKHVLDIYKKMGFKISFDNFGSLNASFEYIKEIEVDFIHFDKYYTKMVKDKIYHNLLKSWVSFFEEIGTKTVIKFIDDKNMIEIFKNIGVDYIQGYAVANPLTSEELKRFLEDKYEIR